MVVIFGHVTTEAGYNTKQLFHEGQCMKRPPPVREGRGKMTFSCHDDTIEPYACAKLACISIECRRKLLELP